MSDLVFDELLHGKGAHADPVACLEDIPAEMAGKKSMASRTPSGNLSAT
jgi:hypothetical protein